MDQMEDKHRQSGQTSDITDDNRHNEDMNRDQHSSAEDMNALIQNTLHFLNEFDKEAKTILDELKTTKSNQMKVNRIEKPLNRGRSGETMTSSANHLRETSKKSKTNSDDCDCNEVLDTKSSFNRFGDDLKELILSFLTFEDKLRFECLSKQIQSLVFNKQYVFRVTKEDSLYQRMASKTKSKKYRINNEILETLLRKLINLSDIEISYPIEVDSKVLYIIANNCHHLKRLTIEFTNCVTAKCIAYFGRKCGQKLEYLSNNTRFDSMTSKMVEKWTQLLSFTPNLVSLKVQNLFKEFLLESNSEIRLPKLRRIEFDYCWCDSINALLNKYRHQLVFVRMSMWLDLRIEARFETIAHLERLKHMKSLELRIIGWSSVEQQTTDITRITEHFHRIGTICRQLTRLDITLWFDHNLNDSSIFKTLTQLTQLNINLNSSQFTDSFAFLRDMKRLKILRIECQELSDECFANVSTYLPQLESLEVSTTVVLTNRSLQLISQLKQLKCLTIVCRTPRADPESLTWLFSLALRQVLDNCLRIKSIVFKRVFPKMCLPGVANMIESFKSTAREMPTIEYHVFFHAMNYFSGVFHDCPPNLDIHMYKGNVWPNRD